MLIPSIDLQGGAVVQLVQGERLAIRDEDVFRWVRRFATFPKVQVIDLDAAMGTRRQPRARAADRRRARRAASAAASARSSARADVLAAGAQQIIAGSALFKDGAPDLAFARTLRDAVGRDRVIAAVDSRGGRVVIHGWKTRAAADRGRRRARARAVLRRVPLHPRRHRRADGRHQPRRHPRRAATPRPAASPPPAASRRRRRSTTSTPSASTRSSAWRSTPAR